MLYCNNKLKMAQRIDALSLQKPRMTHTGGSLFASLKMQEEEKSRSKSRT